MSKKGKKQIVLFGERVPASYLEIPKYRKEEGLEEEEKKHEKNNKGKKHDKKYAKKKGHPLGISDRWIIDRDHNDDRTKKYAQHVRGKNPDKYPCHGYETVQAFKKAEEERTDKLQDSQEQQKLPEYIIVLNGVRPLRYRYALHSCTNYYITRKHFFGERKEAEKLARLLAKERDCAAWVEDPTQENEYYDEEEERYLSYYEAVCPQKKDTNDLTTKIKDKIAEAVTEYIGFVL